MRTPSCGRAEVDFSSNDVHELLGRSRHFNKTTTVNDRLSAAALIKVFRFLGAALIRLRRLFDCGAYFKDC